MKAIYFRAAGAIALSISIAACVPKVTPPLPAPAPVERPSPTPTPAPVVQQPTYENWMDAPQTPGDWRYENDASEKVAVFIGADGMGDFVMSCDVARKQIDLWRAGTSAQPKIMRILTETANRTFQVVQAEDTNPYLTISINARDPIFDAIALSKGRFAVEVEGERTLYLPSWAEVSRVIEDCR